MGTRHDGNMHVDGVLTATTNTPTTGSISDTHIAAGADIATSKLKHRHVIEYYQQDGANIADTTGEGCPVHLCRIASTLVAVEATWCDGSTGTGTCTVDLKKAEDAGGLGATMLNAVITLDNTVADYEPVAAVLAVTALAIGDVLMVIVDETDGDGAPQGLIVTITIDEDAA